MLSENVVATAPPGLNKIAATSMPLSPSDPLKSRPTMAWLVEDHQPFRQMVCRVISRAADFNTPREFANAEAAIAALRDGEKPDVLLLDVELPGKSGLEAISVIKQLAPATQVLMLTVFQDEEKVFKAICAGASGYLLKTSSSKAILDSIREVLAGGAPMSPKIARAVLSMFSAHFPASPAGDYSLTQQERKILGLMAEGLTTKQIAARLGSSYFTVDTHFKSIYGKLHVHTRAGAVSKAYQEKLF